MCTFDVKMTMFAKEIGDFVSANPGGFMSSEPIIIYTHTAYYTN
jgi:hypothetical protein